MLWTKREHGKRLAHACSEALPPPVRNAQAPDTHLLQGPGVAPARARCLNGYLYAAAEVGGDVEILALVEVAVVGITKDTALVLGLHEVE